MAHTKRTITGEAPRGIAAWKLPEAKGFESADLAILLWGRANRLRNLLNVATSREQAMAAAVGYLMALRALAGEKGVPTRTAEVAINWMRACTTARFSVEAMQHAQLLAGDDDNLNGSALS